MVCGVLILLISVPFFAFPKELKREKRKVYLDEKFKNSPPGGDSSAAAPAASSGAGGGKGAASSPPEGTAAEPPAENTYGQSLKVSAAQ